MADDKKYRVGYRKPPREYAFKAGESGNRLGRPRKKGKQVSSSIERMFLEEAHEPIKVREGDRSRELPAIRVVFKQRVRAATQGDAKAADNLIAGVRAAERELHRRNQTLFNAAIEYKDEAEEYLSEFRERGAEAPVLDLDPEDVLLDETSQSVRLSVRSKNISRGAQRLQQILCDQLRVDSNSLTRLLEHDPGNEFIAHDLQNSERLLLRIEGAMDA